METQETFYINFGFFIVHNKIDTFLTSQWFNTLVLIESC